MIVGATTVPKEMMGATRHLTKRLWVIPFRLQNSLVSHYWLLVSTTFPPLILEAKLLGDLQYLREKKMLSTSVNASNTFLLLYTRTSVILI